MALEFDAKSKKMMPTKAGNRYADRADLARAGMSSKARRSYNSGCETVSGQGHRVERNRSNLRLEAKRLIKDNPFIKYAFSSLKTFAAPVDYLAMTGSAEANDRIKRNLKTWTRLGDYRGEVNVWKMFQLLVGLQAIDGAHRILLVKDDELGFRVQSIAESRVGGPPSVKCDGMFGDSTRQVRERKRREALEKAGRYKSGKEYDIKGRLSHYWLYRQTKQDKSMGSLLAGGNSYGWEFDRRVEAQNILTHDDPIESEQGRPLSEFAQAIEQMKDFEEAMDNTSQKVKWASEFILAMNPLGTVPFEGNPADRDDACESECGTKEWEMDSGLKIKGICEDNKLDMLEHNLPGDAFLQFMECLIMAPALSLELPPSFLAMKGKLQGTDVRADLQKAMLALARKRENLVMTVLEPIIENLILFWWDRGDFDGMGLELGEVMSGRWIFRRDPDVDEGRNAAATVKYLEQGVILEDEVIMRRQGDPAAHKRQRKAIVKELLADAKEIADELDLPISSVLPLLKKNEAGSMLQQAVAQQEAERQSAMDQEQEAPQDASLTLEGMELGDYGIGVRSGLITPQTEDENFFRDQWGLPAMSEAAKKAWAEEEGTRRPITLKSKAEMEADEQLLEPETQESDGEEEN